MSKKLTYKDAGVDIKAGDKTVDYIKKLANSTKRKEVISGIGGFGGLINIPKNYKEPVLVSTTDGVGTKLKLAFKLNYHKSIGIDLVAMCINDLVCSGAEPLFFLDYFACGKLYPLKAKEIIEGIVKGCKQSNCTLLGGETAEMPGFYKKDEYDLAGFAVGVLERKNIIDGNDIKNGDALIGIESSGLHSNGYSLAQKVFFDTAKWNIKFKHEDLKNPIGTCLLTPTFIYASLIKKLTNQFKIKGIAHITGGGLTENLPRIFPKGLGCEIDLNFWKRPVIFKLIQKIGQVTNAEMLRTFNNGIGMVLVINPKLEKLIINKISKEGFKSYKIGFIKRGKQKVFYKGVF